MNISEDFFEYFKEDDIHVCYSGPFESVILSVLVNNIENNIIANSVIVKKLYKIFIELTQNIALYSSERINFANGSVGFGSVMLREADDYFVIISGNITNKIEAELIMERCNTINKLSREELREFKRKQRKSVSTKTSSGNIGLIQVALTADNMLDFKIVKLNDEEYFYLVAVKINKIVTEDL